MYSSVKEHQVCVNRALPSAMGKNLPWHRQCFCRFVTRPEKLLRKCLCVLFLENAKKPQKTNYWICLSKKLGLFKPQEMTSQHVLYDNMTPWSIRNESGWGILAHVLSVWLHFLILSPFHCFISSFDWQTAVIVLCGFSFISKNRVSNASLSTHCSWSACTFG